MKRFTPKSVITNNNDISGIKEKNSSSPSSSRSLASSASSPTTIKQILCPIDENTVRFANLEEPSDVVNTDTIDISDTTTTKTSIIDIPKSISNNTKNTLSTFVSTISADNLLKILFLVSAIISFIVTTVIIQNTFLLSSKADPITYPHGPVEPTTISFSNEGNIDLDIIPTPNGDNIAVEPNTSTISTNNVEGYKLTINTDSDTDNKLTHLSPGFENYSINPISSNNSPLEFSSWGYTINNPSTPTTANFNSVPTRNSSVIIGSTSESNATDNNNELLPDTITAYYGAKVSFTEIPAGYYGNTIVYTASSNAVDAPTITNITPNTGSPVGGETITITGTSYDSIISITIDGNDCTDIQITSPTTVTCTTPVPTSTPGQAVDVVVTNQGGSATEVDGFTYTEPPELTYCGTYDYECIMFTVDVTDGTYSIPTSGIVTAIDVTVSLVTHTYDWLVYVDDVLVTSANSSCNDNGNCIGASSINLPNAAGITLTGLSTGTHQIKITPKHDNSPYSKSGSIPGWGNAFGHYSNTAGANISTNKRKLISIDQPLTTMTFAPKTTYNPNHASYMFAYLFHSCTNLTTSAAILDTYKLPSNVYDLSYFLSSTHYGNSSLQSAIDLSQISGWLSSNETITNFSNFLHRTHYNNTSTSFISPIDLEPLENWLSSNETITNFSYFLYYTHADNFSIQSAINLSPISGWFYENEKITNFSGFLGGTHYNNTSTSFISPINLTPLTNWFSSNSSITLLTSFLDGVHSGNSSLQSAINLSPISGWFYENETITNLNAFLNNTHYNNTSTSFISPINLEPLENWFSANDTIISINNFLSSTHYGNSSLQSAIDLSPISDWFYENERITNLSYFLEYTHAGNTSTSFISPINLEPLENWFSANDTITNFSYFLNYTHTSNPNLQSAIDLSPISGWFSANDTITNFSYFLYYTHAYNFSIQSAINLSPISGWFYENNDIENEIKNVTLANFSYFLAGTHFRNTSTSFRSPINLEPLENWFSSNSSISNLTQFLYNTHNDNTYLTAPIDVTPLSGWFASGRTVTTINGGFMTNTHRNNNSLVLTGQIILPEWMMTMTNGDGVPVWNTGAECTTALNGSRLCSFYQTFYRSTTSINDTGEVRFNNASNTVLSAVGTPSLPLDYPNRQTYSGRNGITPVNNNWQ